MEDQAQRELTFGEKAVGLSFNPSQDRTVAKLKEQAAAFIDTCNDIRNAATDGEVKRMASVAITEAQTAQMWGVKAATWILPALPPQDAPAAPAEAENAAPADATTNTQTADATQAQESASENPTA